LLRFLLLRLGGLPTYPRAARLLSLDRTYFRQIISGTNDNKTVHSVIPTMLFISAISETLLKRQLSGRHFVPPTAW
jgi:hypothetical protein